MSKDFDIRLVGDDELVKALRMMEYKTQHKVLKKIAGDTARKIFVGPLKRAHPYDQISRSIGVIKGRSRRVGAAFVGPRMVPGWKLTDKQKQSGNYSGYLAQIVEYNKGQVRTTKKGYSRGVMPTTGKGKMKSTYRSLMPKAERYVMTSLRTIMEREWKRAVKKRIV